MTVSRRLPLLCLAVLLAACAGPRTNVQVPDGAITVATVRHSSMPPHEAPWIQRDALPGGSARSDGERAMLLEVSLRDGQVTAVEPAPLELANLVVRIESRDRRQTVVALENRTAALLEVEWYLSPDGERFRRVPACALEPGRITYERWPERAAWIAVGAVRAVGTDAARCR